MTDIKQPTGLTDSQVVDSRLKYGVNILTPTERTPWWRQLLQKFHDPLIVILLVAGVLSVGISLYEYYGLHQGPEVFFEPVGIFMAILLATGLAFVFEYKADREFNLLNKVADDEPVQVIRNSLTTSIPRRDVVVGDIVLIDTGQEIPADGQLLQAISLNVDESTLTGEPMCHKSVNPDDFDPQATFATDAVLRGTKVMEGHGVMRVTAVGDSTENGRVFRSAQIDNGTRTPLSIQLDRLGRLVSLASYIIGALIIVGRVLIYFIDTPAPYDWIDMTAYLLQTLMIAVTLIVVAVPEGLPMAVTLSLAYSMRRMLKTNNLVRKLHACETMGATTVICTDKTGTLTQNRMQVAEARFFGQYAGHDGEPDPTVALGIAVNSTASLDLTDPTHPVPLGNPTEGALLLWLDKHDNDYSKLRQSAVTVAELPFSTERKYMATVVRTADGGLMLFVKGAPEIVYSLCHRHAEGATRQAVDNLLTQYQNQAMRTLGFASCPLDSADGIFDGGRLSADVDSLTFMGVVAISDPVRPDVPQAIRQVLDAGIQVKIVTGDTPGTAREIGRQTGLWDDAADGPENITTGPEIEAMTDQQLRERAPQLKIIARARPMDKKRLVEALQADGQVVAVTGDGTNDAPALKAAQVGLSMGDGTAVAKEASDITIIDNSFASIGRAVMWGRSLYQNIQRFILFQLTVNVVACLIVLVGAFTGKQSPLTVTQMLWVNLIMDTFAAMALASLPPSASVMKDKPRSQSAFIITRAMWKNIVGVGLTFFVLLWTLLYYMEHAPIDSLMQLGHVTMGSANVGLSPYDLSLFFTVFVFMQFWNMFNARAFQTGRSALHLGGCRGFVFIAAAIFVGQIAIVQIGGPMFNVVPLHIDDWLIIIVGTSLVLWVGELYRALTPKKP